jgi:thiol-disulfide isomerase/thioredoxin
MRPELVTPSSEVVTSTVAIEPTPDLAEGSLVAIEPNELPIVLRREDARAVLVNVWATWCAPCADELPVLLRVGRAYRARGLDTVLISADAPNERAKVRAFLDVLGVDFTTYLRSGNERAFREALDARWDGSIPATFLFDAHGGLRFFQEGPAQEETLREMLGILLD